MLEHKSIFHVKYIRANSENKVKKIAISLTDANLLNHLMELKDNKTPIFLYNQFNDEIVAECVVGKRIYNKGVYKKPSLDVHIYLNGHPSEQYLLAMVTDENLLLDKANLKKAFHNLRSHYFTVVGNKAYLIKREN